MEDGGKGGTTNRWLGQTDEAEELDDVRVVESSHRHQLAHELGGVVELAILKVSSVEQDFDSHGS